MAFALRAGAHGAVPSVDGKPLFVPTRSATIAVGVALLLFAALGGRGLRGMYTLNGAQVHRAYVASAISASVAAANRFGNWTPEMAKLPPAMKSSITESQRSHQAMA